MILVTGANGFVGAPLCEALEKRGHKVRKTTRDPSLANTHDTVFVNSIDNQTHWSDALKDVDTVIHLAARAHVMNENEDDPLQCYRKVNTYGSFRLAKAALSQGVKKFIYISTIKVNGESTTTPFTENSIPNPTDPYGLSKFEAENLLKSLCKDTPMDLIILRPTLIYGPQVKGNLARIMGAVKKKIPLPLGCINNKRTMLYIENLIDLIARLIEKKEKINDTFLVSDRESISTKTLVTSFASILNPNAILLPVPVALLKLLGRILNKSDEIQRLTGNLEVSIDHLEKKLNWTPPYSANQGLIETARHYQKCTK